MTRRNKFISSRKVGCINNPCVCEGFRNCKFIDIKKFLLVFFNVGSKELWIPYNFFIVTQVKIKNKYNKFVHQRFTGTPSSPLTLFWIQLFLEKQWFKAVALFYLSKPEVTCSQHTWSYIYLCLQSLGLREIFGTAEVNLMEIFSLLIRSPFWRTTKFLLRD